jgi:hypothetical protein
MYTPSDDEDERPRPRQRVRLLVNSDDEDEGVRLLVDSDEDDDGLLPSNPHNYRSWENELPAVPTTSIVPIRVRQREDDTTHSSLDEYRQYMDDWFGDHLANQVSLQNAYYDSMNAGSKYR